MADDCLIGLTWCDDILTHGEDGGMKLCGGCEAHATRVTCEEANINASSV